MHLAPAPDEQGQLFPPPTPRPAATERPIETGGRAQAERGRRASLLAVPMLLVLASLNIATAAAFATATSLDVDITSKAPWWSYVPAAVSALAAGAAFLVTALVFRRGSVDRQREQAAAVWAWQTETKRPDGSYKVVGRVHNDSGAPIWRVELRPRRSGDVYADGIIQKHPDVPPGWVAQFVWEVPAAERPHQEQHPIISFTDSADRRWEKIGTKLKRLR